jgi:hypothetical protein
MRPSTPVVRRKSHGSSAVTNRTRAHLNQDERSATARRFRDLVRAFSAEFEGELSEPDIALVRLAASLTLKAEQMQADQVAGKDVAADELIKLAGTVRRTIASVSARAVETKPNGPTALQDYLARRSAAQAEEDEEEDGEKS